MKNLLSKWTPPYCNVSHYETEHYLCTVVDWQRFAEAHIYQKPIRIADCQEKIFMAHNGQNPTEKAKMWCLKRIEQEAQ